MSIKNREQLRELPKELKAYISQQVLEFAPFCLPDSGVMVDIEKEIDDSENEEYFVTITLTGGGAEVRSTGQSPDLYEATRFAKQHLLDHLYNVERDMFSELGEEDSEGESSSSGSESDPQLLH